MIETIFYYSAFLFIVFIAGLFLGLKIDIYRFLLRKTGDEKMIVKKLLIGEIEQLAKARNGKQVIKILETIEKRLSEVHRC